MAAYNKDDYEQVDARLARFWADPANADARIITINHTTPADRSVSTWVVEARLYLNREDHAADLPKTTGWAFEVDGVGMAQKTSALETGETSAIGRCLANYLYPGAVKRASAQEMEKVERGVTPKAPIVITPLIIDQLKDIDAARTLYVQAQKAKASQETLDAIKNKVASFG